MIKQLSSKGKRILVFSDPHQDAERVKKILRKENYDFAVCLGDWFDSHFHQTASDLASTCNLVKTLPFKKNFLTLFGNHDLHYLFSNHYAQCSGYTDEKDTAIADALHPKIGEIRDKFQWYVWIDDILCTHAGVHPYFFPPHLELTKEGITAWLDDQCKYADVSLCNGGTHWFYRAGLARYGEQKIGGVVWMDFDEEFEPVDGLRQIVGHTFNHTGFGVRVHHSNGNLNLAEANDLCIDCNVAQYLIIHNGKVKIKNFNDL